jgi:hypothetical protein
MFVGGNSRAPLPNKALYPIDLCNEYHNRDIKDVWASRRTSTASVRQLSEFCTINTIFLKPLKTKFHQLWGRNTSGHHIRGDRSSTVLSLATIPSGGGP